jgi:hypothetical protein
MLTNDIAPHACSDIVPIRKEFREHACVQALKLKSNIKPKACWQTRSQNLDSERENEKNRPDSENEKTTFF